MNDHLVHTFHTLHALFPNLSDSFFSSQINGSRLSLSLSHTAVSCLVFLRQSPCHAVFLSLSDGFNQFLYSLTFFLMELSFSARVDLDRITSHITSLLLPLILSLSLTSRLGFVMLPSNSVQKFKPIFEQGGERKCESVLCFHFNAKISVVCNRIT